MKRIMIAIAVAASVAWAQASTLEQASVDAQRGFEAAGQVQLRKGQAARVAGAPVDAGFEIHKPKLAPGRKGALLGSFVLADRLDVQRDMLTKQLGTKMWDLGIAGDSEFKILYFTLRNSGRLVLERVNSIQDLRGNGVDVTVEPGVVYNTRVKLDIFDPVKNSTLLITPTQGTSGPSHQVKTGVLLDKAREKSYVFNIGRTEYWCLYTTDVDTNTNQLANTRSVVFLLQAGINSKVWHVAESALAADQPVNVALGGDNITVVRTSGGKLELYEADTR